MKPLALLRGARFRRALAQHVRIRARESFDSMLKRKTASRVPNRPFGDVRGRRSLFPSFSLSLSLPSPPPLHLPRQLREHQLLRELVRGVLVLDDVLRVVGNQLVEVLGGRLDRRARRLCRRRRQRRGLGADGGGHLFFRC